MRAALGQVAEWLLSPKTPSVFQVRLMSSIRTTTSHHALICAFQNFEAALWASPQNKAQHQNLHLGNRSVLMFIPSAVWRAPESLVYLFIYLFAGFSSSLTIINQRRMRSLIVWRHPFISIHFQERSLGSME